MCLAHYWAIPRSDSDFSGRSLFAKAARGERSEGGCLVPRLCQAHAWRHLWISLSFSLLPFSVALYNALFSPRPDRAHLFCARLHRCFGRQPCTRATLLDFDFWFSMESSEFSSEERRCSTRQEFQREVDSAANGTCFVRRVEQRGIPLILPRRENLKDLHLWNKFHATRICYDFKIKVRGGKKKDFLSGEEEGGGGWGNRAKEGKRKKIKKNKLFTRIYRLSFRVRYCDYPTRGFNYVFRPNFSLFPDDVLSS